MNRQDVTKILAYHPSCSSQQFVSFNIILDNIIVKFYYKMNIKNSLVRCIASGKPIRPVSPGIWSYLAYSGRYAIFILLYGLSLVYRGLVTFRLKLYQQQILHQTALPCPVISIGNITTGGTGKTPLTIFVARILRQHGKRVVILSRGYRRKSDSKESKQREGLMVTPDADVRVVGDEPLLIASQLERGHHSALPEIPVIVGRRRSQTGRMALERFHPDVLLLDDGFQHVQLARACDIVLIDATNPFGGGYLLPAGLLREPLTHLRRAHVFVITRSNEVADLTPIREQLRKFNPDAPIFMGSLVCDGFRRAETGGAIPCEDLCGARVLSVSGLGNPASFQRLLETLGLHVAATLTFPDHHWYTPADIEVICQTFRTQQLEAVITTEKDEAKLLLHAQQLNVPLYTVPITMRVQPEREFTTFLLRKV